MRMAILALLMVAAPAAALHEGLQCVPYARALTGVEIRGDAHTWWAQADGRYERGSRPRVGAIMAFRPHGAMRLGHVAAVRKIIDSRSVLVSHANWSTIGGVRGHIEDDVLVVDASEANDWSRVRVWYSPNNALGTTEWPLNGFIYPHSPRSWSEARKAVQTLLGNGAKTLPAQVAVPAPLPRPAGPPAIAARPQPGSFTLSAALIAEIEHGAAKESRRAAAKPKPPAADPIGDIIARLEQQKRL